MKKSVRLDKIEKREEAAENRVINPVILRIGTFKDNDNYEEQRFEKKKTIIYRRRNEENLSIIKDASNDSFGTDLEDSKVMK